MVVRGFRALVEAFTNRPVEALLLTFRAIKVLSLKLSVGQKLFGVKAELVLVEPPSNHGSGERE